MDAPESVFSSLLGILKSWLPWQPEPGNLSRDFWMPDESCRVCYECDSQFNLINRRHHCRFCGRIFCARCSANRVPAPSSEPYVHREEWEKIRVCNYCFKQWQQGLADNGTRVVNRDSSTSFSATSFISFKSTGTVESSNATVASLRRSSGLNLHHPSIMDNNMDNLSAEKPRGINDGTVEMGEQDLSHNPFRYCMTRSDDDDEEFEIYQVSSNQKHFTQINGYDGHYQFEKIDNGYGLQKVHPDEEAVERKSVCSSSTHDSFGTPTSEEIQQNLKKEVDHDVSYECEASSTVDSEPVDFENNGVLWLPPEPEDEEEERETLLYDEEEDGDVTGEWGYLRNSSSFGSGEHRSRDRSNEEHKNVMKNVVDGHFRALIAQLMQVENLPVDADDEKESWLEIVTSLAWEAATILKPDTSKGGGMDPGGYVKVKCIASGHRSESMVIKGVVCKKNVAHRRMTSRIEKPRILILGGALEYQRVSNHLSSFDTLLQQEMDYLKMAVAKVDVHHPDVLLVEKSVSRYAQDYLLAKDISLVLNVKKPLLERIARCTGGQIVASIDHLSSQKLGYCDLFHVERFLEDHGTAGQGGKKLVKTLMYFEGCPKPLGCTVLLRGANGDELKKVKHVIQYAVFAAYHLALETSFLADEGASLPELPLSAPITVALPDKPSAIERSISTIPGFTVQANEMGLLPGGEPQRSSSIPTSDLTKTTITSMSEPETNEFSSFLTATSSFNFEPCLASYVEGFPSSSFTEPSPCHDAKDRSAANMIHSSVIETTVVNISLHSSVDHLIPINFGDSDALEQGVMANTEQYKLGAADANLCNSFEEPASSKEEFPQSSSDRQSILVSLSSRCVWKGTVCERSHLFRIKYYGNFDKPLGRFLRDHLFDQNYRCRSCEMPSEAHVQCYTHRQGTLTISVKKLAEILLTGEKEGKIWMWHRCLRCPRTNGFPPATRRVVMSDAAWGLSFGKFLELSFSNHAAASRVASCGHSLHRDCLRFYGFGNMVACFRYASIDVYSVYLPPPKLEFRYENQDWIQQELNEVVGRAKLLFSHVLDVLHVLMEKKSSTFQLNSGIKVPESVHRITNLKELLQQEKAEFDELVQQIWTKEAEKGQPSMDILEVNRLRIRLLAQSILWEGRLEKAASSDDKGNPDDIAPSSEHLEETSVSEKPNCPITMKMSTSVASFDPTNAVSEPTESCDSSAKQVDLPEIVQGVDKCLDSAHGGENLSNCSIGINSSAESDPSESDVVVRRALSDGHLISSLSDTLDAAWTGENLPVFGASKDCTSVSSEPATGDSSTTARLRDKHDLEESKEDLGELNVTKLSSKGSANIEESVSWFGMPFISLYRSLNKNFLGSSQKLDSPVYTSAFRDSEAQTGARLCLPVGVNGTIIPVYDDEPTSIISYALVSTDYYEQLSDKLERPKDTAVSTSTLQSFDSGSIQSSHSFDETTSEPYRNLGSADEILSTSGSHGSLDPVSYNKALHARISFDEDGPLGKANYTVTCYYAKRFDALRRICCPSEIDFVRSLSRCKKWGAQGGKSNVFFAKTLDDRFIIKQVTKTELESFIKFAPGYFKYLSESISSGSPTCLAKILGLYQVTSRHLKGGRESKMDVLVMENLLFGRNLTRLYDLKGSSRSRYNPDSSGSNKVLLDQNLIESMPTSPIFVGNKAKRLLERAVWNDAAFLASIDVMDYSLLVGVDEEKHELVLGIIDFMRQYTWDKHLETWVKASGILGGPRNASPTVISPKQYKKRFRKAMTTYFLMVPDQWSPSTIIPSKSQTDLCEEDLQAGASAE